MKNKNIILLSLIPLLASCSINQESYNHRYLNYKYTLVRAGDLHGISPTSKENLAQNKGFTSYITLFDKSKSFINFQCIGNNASNFHCETTFVLYDKSGNLLAGGEDIVFNTSYSGVQSGKIKYEDPEIGSKLGTIYVYTPYWCRWQFEYDVDGSGNKTLLTFEFWKSTFNPVPEWSE